MRNDWKSFATQVSAHTPYSDTYSMVALRASKGPRKPERGSSPSVVLQTEAIAGRRHLKLYGRLRGLPPPRKVPF